MLKQYEIPDGVYTVLVTPFNKNNSIDYESMKNWFEIQIDTNVTGIVILGTTSESPTLSIEEQYNIVKFTYDILKNKKFIIVGVGGNNTMATLEFAKLCLPYADAFMVTVPCYNKPPQEGIYQHFRTICSQLDKPVMLYNVPGRTCVNMLPDTVVRVVRSCNNVCAIKEASGNLEQMKEIIMKIKTETCRDTTKNFKLFSGDDGLIVDACKLGGRGVISVASNVVPYDVATVVDYCLKGEYDTAHKCYNYIDKLVKLLFRMSNPIPVKYLLHATGIFKTDVMRLPLVSITDINYKKELMNEYKKTITS